MPACTVSYQLPTFGVRGRGRRFKEGAELDGYEAWAKKAGRRASAMCYLEYVNRYNAQVHGILPPSAAVPWCSTLLCSGVGGRVIPRTSSPGYRACAAEEGHRPEFLWAQGVQ